MNGIRLQKNTEAVFLNQYPSVLHQGIDVFAGSLAGLVLEIIVKARRTLIPYHRSQSLHGVGSPCRIVVQFLQSVADTQGVDESAEVLAGAFLDGLADQFAGYGKLLLQGGESEFRA